MLTILLCAAALSAAAPPATAPTLAVLGLRAETRGVAGEANLLADLFTDRLRAAGVFSRVTSTKEIQDVLTTEQQRQLLDCDAGSCMAELAGALGVDLVFRGSLGRVGSVMVLNLSMVESASGNARASLSETFPDGLDRVVLNADVLVHNLLVAGNFVKGPRKVLRAAAGQEGDPAEDGGGGNVAGRVLLGAGGVGLVSGVGLFLAGGALAALATAVLVVPVVVGIPTPFLPLSAKRQLVVGSGTSLGGVSLLVGAVSLLVVTAGAVGLGVGAWLAL